MKIRFNHHQPVNDNIVSFYFDKPDNFDYIAGQYIEMSFDNYKAPPDEDETRWFTLSSSPSESYLSITTRITTPRRKFKDHLYHLKADDRVNFISGPMGDFVLPKQANLPLVFIAGGIGITPVRSITKWLSDTREIRNISLDHFASKAGDLIFSDLFRNYKMSFQPIVTGNKPLDLSGLPSIKSAEPNSLFYVSGPEPVVETIADLIAQKYSKEQVIMDYFPGYTSV